MDEIPGPGAQAQLSDARSPPAQGKRCPSHARYLPQARPDRTCRAEAPPPRPAPGEGAGPREGKGACLQTRGRARGKGARGGRRPGLTGHSPRPLSPIPSRPASPGSGSGVCCSPAAAAGSSQGRRRRHRDATPQCISFLTPTGPHCPAACRGGRKGGRAAQDMTPGPRVGGARQAPGTRGGAERGDSGSAAGDSGLRRRARLGTGVTAPGRPPFWCGREVSSRAPAPSPTWERRRRSPPARQLPRPPSPRMTPAVRLRAGGAAAPSAGRRHVGKGSGVLPDLAGARGVTATSQHTENREDPGAGEDSPPLPCGALRAFFPLAPTVGHRDEGPERPWSCGSLARAVSVVGGVCIRVGCRGAREPALGTM